MPLGEGAGGFVRLEHDRLDLGGKRLGVVPCGSRAPRLGRRARVAVNAVASTRWPRLCDVASDCLPRRDSAGAAGAPSLRQPAVRRLGRCNCMGGGSSIITCGRLCGAEITAVPSDGQLLDNCRLLSHALRVCVQDGKMWASTGAMQISEWPQLRVASGGKAPLAIYERRTGPLYHSRVTLSVPRRNIVNLEPPWPAWRHAWRLGPSTPPHPTRDRAPCGRGRGRSRELCREHG